MSAGQVLLRAAAIRSTSNAEVGWQSWLNGVTLLAIVVYGCAMLLWLWLLSRVPLSQAFAFFGLSFILVPLLAHRFLGDPVSPGTWLGATLVMVGIAVSTLPRT
ncbi:MAG: EamA family transporter [Rubrivivax sp.]|nr:EamA family transporter [Rubrivivax sp.]